MSFNMSLMGLRGFAAMAVLMFHVWSGALKDNFMPSAVPEVLRIGFLCLQFGVQLFFMISGYLITASIIRHNNIRRFLLDRALRIYPAFLPVLALIFVLGFVSKYNYFDGVSGIEWAGLFIVNLLFIPGIYPIPPALLVAWTLSYEALFYFFCSLVFLFSKKAPRGIVIFATIFFAAAAIYFYPSAIFFAVGAGVYFLRPYLDDFGKATQSWTCIALIIFFASLLFVEENMNFEPFRPVIISVLWIVATISGAIVFISVIAEGGVFCRLLRLPALQWLGVISYSL